MEVLVLAYLLGGLVTFLLMAYADLIRSPFVEYGANIILSLIWPVCAVAFLMRPRRRGID